MLIKKIINCLVYFCFFIVPCIVWLKNYHPFIAMKDSLFVCIISAAFALLLISFVVEGRLTIRKSRLHVAVACYFIYNLASFLLMPYIDKTYFWVLSSLVMLYFVISYTFSEESRDIVLYLLFFVSLFSSIYAFMQFNRIDLKMFVNYFGERISGSRAFTFFGNPNLLGGFSVMMLPIMLGYAIHSLRQGKKLLSLTFFCLAALDVMSLGMSQTRGSWIAGGIAIVLFLSLYERSRLLQFISSRRIALLSVAAVFLIVLFLGLLINSRHTFLPDTSSLLSPATLEVRSNYYRNAISMIKDNPLFGKGVGTFNVYYPKYRDNRVSARLGETNMEFRVEHAHNEHLEILSDLGIIGYALFIWIIAEALILLFKRGGIIEIGIVVGIIAILVDGIFSQNLRHTVISSMLWLLIGIASISYEALSQKGRKQQQSFGIGKASMMLLILCLLFFPISFAFNTVMADTSLALGLGLYSAKHANEAVSVLGDVLSHDIFNKPGLYYMAASYTLKGDDALALKYYEKLLLIDPYFIQANYHAGIIYLSQSNIPRGEEYLLRQIAANNMFYKAYYALSYVYAQQGEYGNAITSLKEVENINAILPLPNDDYHDIMRQLAKLYIRVGDTPDAKAILSRLAKSPDDNESRELLHDLS